MIGGLGGDCLDNRGYIPAEATRASAIRNAAIAKEIAAGVLAASDAKELVDNYKKKFEIQSKMVAIEEEAQTQLRDVFWPKELDFLEEQCTPDELETAEQYGRRRSGRLMATVAGAYAKEIGKLKRCAPRYCTSANNKAIQDLYLSYAEAMSNAKLLGRVLGFLDLQKRKDRNFERKLQAIGLGRGLMREAARLYKSAIENVNSAGSILSGNLSSALAAVGKFDQERQQAGNRLNTLDLARQAAKESTSDNRLGNAITLNSLGYEGLGVLRDPVQTFLPQWGTVDTLFQTEQPDFTFENSPVAEAMQFSAAPSLGAGSQDMMRGQSNDAWNEADVGNRDLVRTGQYTYQGYDGYPITVKMSDFAVQFADHANPGDKQISSGGGMGI